MTSTSDDYETTCDPWGGSYGSGPDEFWEFTPSSSGTLTIEMDPDGWDYCAIEVMTDCGNSGTSLACDAEPYPATDSFCSLTLSVSAGTTYYIAAESHSETGGSGPYDLTLTM